MKTFNRTSIPERIEYNNKIYHLDIGLSNAYKDGKKPHSKNVVLVKVLSRKLKGVTDLHGTEYKPSEWIFACHLNKPTKRTLRVGDKIRFISEDWGEYKVDKLYSENPHIWEISNYSGSRTLGEGELNHWYYVK